MERDGFPVFYTRTNDIYQSPVEKAQIANASGGDYFVSFHRNAAASPNLYHGVQTLIYDDSGIKSALARNVNNNMVDVGFENLGIEERKNLAVLRRTNMPAILIEAGFIDSDKDNALFDNNFDRLADAIADGIKNTVGTPVAKTVSAVSKKRYGVQVGLYRRFENAAFVLNNLLKQGYDGKIVERNSYYAVVVGDFNDIDLARNLERKLLQDGYETLIIRL